MRRPAVTLYQSPPGTPEIVARSVRKAFGAKQVLADVSFTINSGEMVAIVGASGGGKTVLLDHLTGLLTPTSGTVHVADHTLPDSPLIDLNAIDEDRLDMVRLAWAIVFQRNALFSGTVFDNIALWLREHSGMDDDRIRRRVRESIAAAALDVDDVIQKDRDSLSGGMAKRVAIARAIASDPLTLFYDEPTTGLDPVISAHIHELIWNTHHRTRRASDGETKVDGHVHRTSIIVTHDKELLRRLSPRVIMLDAGRIIFDGPYGSFTACTHPTAVQYMRSMPELHQRADGSDRKHP